MAKRALRKWEPRWSAFMYYERTLSLKFSCLVKGTGLESYETNELVPSQGEENRIIVRAMAMESLFGLQEALLEP